MNIESRRIVKSRDVIFMEHEDGSPPLYGSPPQSWDITHMNIESRKHDSGDGKQNNDEDSPPELESFPEHCGDIHTGTECPLTGNFEPLRTDQKSTENTESDILTSEREQETEDKIVGEQKFRRRKLWGRRDVKM